MHNYKVTEKIPGAEIDKSNIELTVIFDALRLNQSKIGASSAKERIIKLKKLLAAIYEFKQEIRDALYNDFKKPSAEVDLTEIYVLISELKYTIKNLKEWMALKPVATPLPMMGSNSYIQYESKGVCLIISPWNFPFQLALGPLITAVAAGNSVIIKPSENTPHTSKLINKIVSKVFNPDEVKVIEGGVPITTKLLSLPFNHIFFTGSPQVGKIVMRAAANHLASITLELGGKSPTIIDDTADLDIAAKRTAWGKFLNNGQICLAPDYVLIHENVKDKFVGKVSEYITKYYGNDPKTSNAYARMVNSNHYNRVKSYIEDAISRGGKILIGGTTDDKEKYISPTIVENVSPESNLMVDEIFGPVLPIVTFKSIDEAINLINSKERPLGLYIYSKNKRNINKIMLNTRAGGTSINHNNVHFLNHYLPFGGVNNSGIGKAHGWYGFEAFSNARSVLKQNMPGALDLLMPPYTTLKQKLIDFTLKYM